MPMHDVRTAGSGDPILRVRCPWADPRTGRFPITIRNGACRSTTTRSLFELITLEGAQAGLSWDTILRKRAGYRAAFAGFDPAAVARFDAARVAELALDPAIVRHRGKIASTVANAAAFLRVQAEFGSFSAYVWRFVDGVPVVTRRHASEALPGSTPLSDAVSADLRRRGFTFVGSTIVYAFLQAAGIVDDHRASCFRAGG